MKTYVGTKIIQAEPMDKDKFESMYNHRMPEDIAPQDCARPGYYVQYPDGYKSWSPAETFRTAYREITNEERSLIDARA